MHTADARELDDRAAGGARGTCWKRARAGGHAPGAARAVLLPPGQRYRAYADVEVPFGARTAYVCVPAWPGRLLQALLPQPGEAVAGDRGRQRIRHGVPAAPWRRRCARLGRIFSGACGRGAPQSRGARHAAMSRCWTRMRSTPTAGAPFTTPIAVTASLPLYDARLRAHADAGAGRLFRGW